MKRRIFIKTISTAAIASGTIGTSKITPQKILQFKKTIKPNRLKEGDTIALISPGSYITKEEKREAIEKINNLGFNVVYSEKLMKKNGYFSATDKERAADLNEMFSRNDVQGIMCARGGYGCTRILPFINYNIIKANPKVFIGFSDVTAIHYSIYKNTGLITFHGPVGVSSFNNFSVNNFRKVLMNPIPEIELANSSSGVNYNIYGITTITNGIAEGELVGGNLSIVASLIGTDYDLDSKGKIIFLEEFNEEPYRIDRMLTQMLQAGKFNGVAGISLGVFKLCEPSRTNPAFVDSYSLMDVLKDRLSDLGIPVVYGLSFGHVKDKLTFPFGLNVELSAERQTLKLLEPAVL